MLLFHLVAAALTAALLAGGESMLFRLFAALHRVLLAGSDPLDGLAAAGLDRGDHRRGRWTLLRETVASAVSRRGPPVSG